MVSANEDPRKLLWIAIVSCFAVMGCERTERSFEPSFLSYEEDGAGTSVYKFEIVRDGTDEWRPAGDPSDAWYRVDGDRLQFYRFDKDCPPTDRAQLEAFLRDLAPLRDSGVIEIWIGKDEKGFYLRDYRFETDGPIAAPLEKLDRESFSLALARVNELTWKD